MRDYRWTLADGSVAKLWFSPHLDNILTKHHGKAVVERASLIDCGIVAALPHILRYCFEEQVDLRERSYLRRPAHPHACVIDEYRLQHDWKRPLRADVGVIRSVNKGLVIGSTPEHTFHGTISFQQENVAELVEGIGRVLDSEATRLGHLRCMQTIQFYHRCLDDGFFR